MSARKPPGPGTCEVVDGGALIVCGALCSIRDLAIIARLEKANRRARTWRERRRQAATTKEG